MKAAFQKHSDISEFSGNNPSNFINKRPVERTRSSDPSYHELAIRYFGEDFHDNYIIDNNGFIRRRGCDAIHIERLREMVSNLSGAVVEGTRNRLPTLGDLRTMLENVFTYGNNYLSAEIEQDTEPNIDLMQPEPDMKNRKNDP